MTPLMPNQLDRSSLQWQTGGKQTIPRAGLTAAIVTSLLQLSVNQVRVVRLQLLARRAPDEAAEVSTRSKTTTNDAPTPFDNSLRSSLDNPTTQPPLEEAPGTLPGQMIRGLSTFLPVRKLIDDDYLALLNKKKNEVDRRLKEIEQEEWRIFQSAQQEDGKHSA